MSWETEFEEFYNDEVIRQEYTGQDGYGQETHGTATTLFCRVVHKPQLLRLAGAGETRGTVREVVSTAQVWNVGIIGWDHRDKITLPDGSSPKILQIVKYPDEEGDHHEVVYV